MNSWSALCLLVLMGGCQQRAEGPRSAPEVSARKEPEAVDTPRQSPSTPPTSQEALAAFQRFWDTELAKGGNPALTRLTPLVKTARSSLVRRTFAEYGQGVRNTLGDTTAQPAILFGSLESLRGEGECWEVFFDGLLRGGVSGCVDARAGRVLFVWETPEG